GVDVAGVSEIEDVCPCAAPPGGEAAARKGEQRSSSRRASRLVRRSVGLLREAWVDRRELAEELGMDARRVEAQGREGVPHLGHERSRTAEGGAGVPGNGEPGQ